MSTKFRLELDHQGIQELLSSGEVSTVCRNAAEAIRNAAGDGFEVSGQKTRVSNKYGTSRVAYSVHAETYEAKLAEAEDKVLSGAVSQCRC